MGTERENRAARSHGIWTYGVMHAARVGELLILVIVVLCKNGNTRVEPSIATLSLVWGPNAKIAQRGRMEFGVTVSCRKGWRVADFGDCCLV